MDGASLWPSWETAGASPPPPPTPTTALGEPRCGRAPAAYTGGIVIECALWATVGGFEEDVKMHLVPECLWVHVQHSLFLNERTQSVAVSGSQARLAWKPWAGRCSPAKGRVPRLHRAAGGMATHLAETGESPETGGRESGPRVLGIAHHGTISVSVLENIIAPRAPRSSPAPDRLPARRSLRCGAGAPWPPARGLRRLWGPGAASWCQSALIVKPDSETQPAPASPLHPPALPLQSSLARGSICAGTCVGPGFRAGFASGRSGEGHCLHGGF